VLVLLLTSVAVRSLVGLSASRGYPRDTWLLLGLPLAAALGKGVGGFLADRWGWVRTTVTALLVAVPLVAVQYPHPLPLLAGLLVFQTTMPVTLVAVARLLPGRPGTAFGLPCLALAVGALPTMTAWGAGLCVRPVLGCWVLTATVATWAGLTAGETLWRIHTGSAERPGSPARAEAAVPGPVG
jgi:FSR family fosmidomycin resistance protein-like MFS transporter